MYNTDEAIIALCAQGHSKCRQSRRAVPWWHQLLLRGPGETLHVHGQSVGRGKGHRRLGPVVCHSQVQMQRRFYIIKATVSSFVPDDKVDQRCCWFIISVFCFGGFPRRCLHHCRQLLSCSFLYLGWGGCSVGQQQHWKGGTPDQRLPLVSCFCWSGVFALDPGDQFPPGRVQQQHADHCHLSEGGVFLQGRCFAGGLLCCN